MPSQCPLARAWLTICAHDAATAVGAQGSTTPPTQATPPNMAARSEPSKTSGVPTAPKLGNANPSSLATSVKAMFSLVSEEPLPHAVITEASNNNPPPMNHKFFFIYNSDFYRVASRKNKNSNRDCTDTKSWNVFHHTLLSPIAGHGSVWGTPHGIQTTAK